MHSKGNVEEKASQLSFFSETETPLEIVFGYYVLTWQWPEFPGDQRSVWSLGSLLLISRLVPTRKSAFLQHHDDRFSGGGDVGEEKHLGLRRVPHLHETRANFPPLFGMTFKSAQLPVKRSDPSPPDMSWVPKLTTKFVNFPSTHSDETRFGALE